ncbi:MFS transporter [Novosphingobium sp. 1949]|uniref:MFS transporter n=1 Tax=Novosphingobium organovorum TaxID=2930092 RepID=A0ABT0B867_9SPHN|nr:MFS transporter [Novosphingobium organovorum]MCJ2181271.1 MFS transporter [Novosphingobium organovorum]
MVSSPTSPATDPKASVALSLLVAGTFFMENLDATVITPAVPMMARSFARAPVDLNLGISAYMLTLAIFIPASGWIAERFGARRIFALAIAAFSLASLACALAPNLPAFVAARIAQGIGGAMMVPVGRLVVLRATPKDDLVRAIATLTWPALIAPVLGPPVGGWIAEHADWRWIFLLNLPLGLVALLLSLRLVPESRGKDGCEPFDWTGFALCGAGLLAVMMAVEALGRGTSDIWPLAGATLVGGGLIALAWRHMQRVRAPMLGLGALAHPTFAVTIWGGTLFRIGVSAVPFLVPLMLQIALGWSASRAGLMLMAVFAGNLTMKPLTTGVMNHLGFRTVLLGNGLLNAASIAALALIAQTSPTWLIAAILFVSGMTRSMQFTALNTIAFADVEQEGMNDANTLFSTVMQLGIGLGIAVGALAWRAGQALFDAPPVAAFHAAFVIVALVSLAGLLDALRLAPAAGERVLKRT